MIRWVISLAMLVLAHFVHGTDDHSHQPEPLYGVKIAGDSFVIQVRSFGCTDASSFKIIQSKDNVTITRIKQDRCRRMPHLIWLSLDRQSLSLPFILQNPIASNRLSN
ncbi:hypothetical protein [Pseudoalteromonas sp. A25]|uniref:hypothetical protein n=1 Tax=Pseudoalteromonas sp. A25 TaxID=116092 RepID=UPI0012607D50|nr:hypothetical protein [Pseudoalteromonas sp. A25]